MKNNQQLDSEINYEACCEFMEKLAKEFTHKTVNSLPKEQCEVFVELMHEVLDECNLYIDFHKQHVK